MYNGKLLKERFTMRWEQDAIRDRWGRAPSYTSTFGNVLSPLVSQEAYRAGFKPRYPDGHAFAVCLSHDVDALFTPRRELFGLMRRGHIPSNTANISAMFQGKVDPRYSLEHILNAEQAIGASSTFYFLALDEDDEDFNFQIDAVTDQLRMVSSAGCEIGLHGGHRAWHDASTLAREKERLVRATGRSIGGYRNHFLRFNTPDTWHLLRDQGFTYDTTLGYSDTIGFRNGMCYPFRPVDVRTDQRIDILEIPLVVMDIALFDHMKLDRATALNAWQRTVDEVKACNGVFTLLWHNSYPTVPVEIYGELISRLRDQGAWFTTGQGLAEHWSTTGQQDALESCLAELFNDIN